MAVSGVISPRGQGIAGIRFFEVSANPGALGAVAAVDVDVIVALGYDIGPADSIWVSRMPATLEARLVVQGVSIPSANTVRLRFANQSAGAATGGALTYELGVCRR